MQSSSEHTCTSQQGIFFLVEKLSPEFVAMYMYALCITAFQNIKRIKFADEIMYLICIHCLVASEVNRYFPLLSLYWCSVVTVGPCIHVYSHASSQFNSTSLQAVFSEL